MDRGCVVLDQPLHDVEFTMIGSSRTLRLVFDTAAVHF
jgi:hypothetical protein